jgi:hypothetical protein
MHTVADRSRWVVALVLCLLAPVAGVARRGRCGRGRDGTPRRDARPERRPDVRSPIAIGVGLTCARSRRPERPLGRVRSKCVPPPKGVCAAPEREGACAPDPPPEPGEGTVIGLVCDRPSDVLHPSVGVSRSSDRVVPLREVSGRRHPWLGTSPTPVAGDVAGPPRRRCTDRDDRRHGPGPVQKSIHCIPDRASQ